MPARPKNITNGLNNVIFTLSNAEKFRGRYEMRMEANSYFSYKGFQFQIQKTKKTELTPTSSK